MVEGAVEMVLQVIMKREAEVELEVIEPLVMALHLYKEVHYFYHQDLIQLQLVVVEQVGVRHL